MAGCLLAGDKVTREREEAIAITSLMSSSLTGFFRLNMRANGEESPAIAQLHPPGLAREQLIRVVRCEWADRLRPGVSQNRIECLGWEAIEAPPADWEPMKARSAHPVTIWRPVPRPNA